MLADDDVSESDGQLVSRREKEAIRGAAHPPQSAAHRRRRLWRALLRREASFAGKSSRQGRPGLALLFLLEMSRPGVSHWLGGRGALCASCCSSEAVDVADHLDTDANRARQLPRAWRV